MINAQCDVHVFSFHIKDLEYSRLVEKAINTLQDERILDLEKATSIIEHILQNHTTILVDITGKLSIISFFLCFN